MRTDQIDISHLNSPVDFHALAAAGVAALCNKASQGLGFRDPSFTANMARASEVGWMRLAYHFVDGSAAADQWANFREVISGTGSLFLALDIEHNPEGSQVTAEVANELITLIVGETGRHPLLYGSDVLSGMITGLSDKCPLWVARYGAEPPGWPNPARLLLWQWSDDGNGAGVPRGVDCSQWMGAAASFADWYAANAITI